MNILYTVLANFGSVSEVFDLKGGLEVCICQREHKQDKRMTQIVP
jgi:hypothetical protein